MKFADRIIGGVMALFAIICFVETNRIWNGWGGTGTMTLIVGGICIVISIIFLIFPSRETTSIQWPVKKEMLSIGVIGGIFALYINLMNWLGYPISTWLFLAVVTRYISPRRISTILIWTGMVAVGTYIILNKYLFMSLPAGFIGI